MTPSDDETWVFTLYIADESPRSKTARQNLQRLCEDHLDHPYRIDVVDLTSDPDSASKDQIVALPTVVRRLPEPVRKLIGDLSSMHDALLALDILPREE